MKSKILAAFLALMMVMSLIPFGVVAAESAKTIVHDITNLKSDNRTVNFKVIDANTGKGIENAIVRLNRQVPDGTEGAVGLQIALGVTAPTNANGETSFSGAILDTLVPKNASDEVKLDCDVLGYDYAIDIKDGKLIATSENGLVRIFSKGSGAVKAHDQNKNDEGVPFVHAAKVTGEGAFSFTFTVYVNKGSGTPSIYPEASNKPEKTEDAQYTYEFADEYVGACAAKNGAWEYSYEPVFNGIVNQYTITWNYKDAQGNDKTDTTSVAYGNMPAHADPEGYVTADATYTFAGWDSEVVAVTGNAAYTATYNEVKSSRTVKAIVKDNAGKPVAGIEVNLVLNTNETYTPADHVVIGTGVTDSEGIVTFKDVKYDNGLTTEMNLRVDIAGKSYAFDKVKDGGARVLNLVTKSGVDLQQDDDGNDYALIKDVNNFYAEFELNVKPVAFTLYVSDDVNPDREITVIYGEPINDEPAVPVRPGYTFIRWGLRDKGTTEYDAYLESGKVASYEYNYTCDAELKAEYSVNTYTITYVSDGVTVATDSVKYLDKYSVLDATAVTKEGYTLVGWNLDYNGVDYYFADSSLQNLTYTALKDVTFTALWKANVYDDGIILDAKEGKILVDGKPGYLRVDMTYGTTYTLPAAEKDGYTFKGWKLVTDSNEVAVRALKPEVETIYPAGTEIKYEITTGMIFEAQWQANRYTVYFDADGGSYTGAKKMVVTFGQPYGKLPEPARTGCSFQYWVDENGKAVNEHELVEIPHDHVLTAVYHVNELGNTEVLPRLFGLYVDWNKDGGSIKGVHYSNRDLLIALNAKRTLYFEPAEGYEVSEVFVNGVSVGNPSSFTIMNARMDYSVKVEYAPKAVYTPVYAEDFTGETSNWQVGGQLENFAIADGALKMTSTGGDPIIMPVENFNLKADDIDVIRIRYKNATGNANVQVFFTSDANTGLSEAGSFKATAANVDGTEWNEIVIDTSVNELWTGTIGIVRLDLASAAGELVLDSISFETVSYAK